MRPFAMMYPEDQEARYGRISFSEKIFWLRRFLMKQKSGKSIFPEGRWISLWNLNDEMHSAGALRCQLIKRMGAYSRRKFSSTSD